MSTFDQGGFAVLVKDLSQVFDVANTVAPEHQLIENPENYLLFRMLELFSWGIWHLRQWVITLKPSHVLPTDRSARFASALTIHDFIKDIHVISMGANALKEVANTIIKSQMKKVWKRTLNQFDRIEELNDLA